MMCVCVCTCILRQQGRQTEGVGGEKDVRHSEWKKKKTSDRVSWVIFHVSGCVRERKSERERECVREFVQTHSKVFEGVR